MKATINAKLLKALPPAVAERVKEWGDRCHKRGIHLERTATLYFDEDAKLWIHNDSTGKAAEARVAGEWAGNTGLRPSADMPLYEGLWAVETGISCGHRFLIIHQGIKPVPAPVLADPVPVLELELC